MIWSADAVTQVHTTGINWEATGVISALSTSFFTFILRMARKWFGRAVSDQVAPEIKRLSTAIENLSIVVARLEGKVDAKPDDV